MKFAVLVEPDLDDCVHNDEELYAAVKIFGKAIIQEFKFAGSLECNPPIELTPQEFESTWKGD